MSFCPFRSATRWLLLTAFLSLSIVTAAAAVAAPQLDSGIWLPFPGITQGCNGRVNAMAEASDGRIAVGGAFDNCGGVAANNVAIFDPASSGWSAAGGGITAPPESFAEVYALTWFNGELVAGGEFTHAGGNVAHDLARWDGSHWSGFGLTGLGTTTYSLAANASYLYAGGGFETIGGAIVRGFARWDGNTWSSVGSSTQNFSGGVRTILLDGSDVYVGGSFAGGASGTANRVARWNGTTWSTLGSGSTNGVGGSVNALAIYGSDLYVAGQFTLAGGLPARNIARWNGVGWSSLDGIGGNGVNSQVRALQISDGQLVVGGYFTQAGGGPALHLARWNGSAWSSFASEIGGGVNTLLAANQSLYVGGFHRYAGGIPADHIARLDAGGWGALGSPRSAANGVNDRIVEMVTAGDDVFLCGWFTEAGAGPIRNIARLGNGSWSGLNVGGEGSALTILGDGNDLYAAGNFYFLGNTTANKVARWDGLNWHPLGGGIGTPNSTNDVVYALEIFNGELYAGGSFSRADGQPATNLARWNGTSWIPMFVGSFGNAQAIYALKAVGDYLYVGGHFSSAGGVPARNIARFDGSNWSALAGAGNQGVNDYVLTILGSGSDIYVGGAFTEAGGQAINYIARWNGSDWHTLGAGLGAAFRNTVEALIEHEGVLYVGGNFSSAGGIPTNNIARWSAGALARGTAWAMLVPMAQSLRSPSSAVPCMSEVDSTLSAASSRRITPNGSSPKRPFSRAVLKAQVRQSTSPQHLQHRGQSPLPRDSWFKNGVRDRFHQSAPDTFS